MRSFISRKRERLHHARGKHIRESSLDRIELLLLPRPSDEEANRERTNLLGTLTCSPLWDRVPNKNAYAFSTIAIWSLRALKRKTFSLQAGDDHGVSFSVADSFTYRVSDGKGSADTITVVIKLGKSAASRALPEGGRREIPPPFFVVLQALTLFLRH
jgi:hypothetical protein